MSRTRSFTALVVAFVLTVASMTGCTDARVVSANITKDAEQFRIKRRIVFYNGITDNYILTIEGTCNIEVQSGEKQLEVICKTGETSYKKHFLGLSDNVTYFAEQIESSYEDRYHYKVVFKPSVVVPSVEHVR